MTASAHTAAPVRLVTEERNMSKGREVKRSEEPELLDTAGISPPAERRELQSKQDRLDWQPLGATEGSV